MSKPKPGTGAEISVSSRLDASPAAVWDRVMTPEGINDEMRPYLRMTLPRGVERIDLNHRLGTTVGLLVNALHPPDERLPGIEIDKVGWH